MRAFVLSGGGNRGPLQAAAIRALLRHGITPDLVVGSSVGALHGAYLAAEPTLAQAEHMIALWRDAGRRKLFGRLSARALLKALRGDDHLADNRRLRAYIAQTLPAGVRTFGDLRIPLYVTICHLQTLTLYLYGDDPSASLVDAVLTSAAVPGFFPPAYHAGHAFVDGGVVSNLPVSVALARGATEIWALDLAFEVDTDTLPRNIFEIAGHAIRRPLYDSVLRELEGAIRQPEIVVHHIALPAYANLPLGDFSKTEAMLVEGERLAEAYLARPRPNTVRYPRRYSVEELPPGPPGARPFVWHEAART